MTTITEPDMSGTHPPDPPGGPAWVAEVRRLAAARDAVILAHNYQAPEIQDVADHVGDSLALSRLAASADASTIVFAGVWFMAETAKILSPERTVLIPDPAAGCSLADSITAAQLREWKAEHPGAAVVAYVNTSAEVKAETDVCCTSANAVEIVAAIPADREILFLPDQFLGAHVQRATGRTNMHIWMGECHVHAGISPADLRDKAAADPDAAPYIHPECGCTTAALWLAGTGDLPAERTRALSTGGMLVAAREETAARVLVATETGVPPTSRLSRHRSRLGAPGDPPPRRWAPLDGDRRTPVRPSGSLDPAVGVALADAGLDPGEVERIVRTALAEDLRFGPDVTTAATVDPAAVATADVVAHASGVVAGVPVALAVLDLAGLPIGGFDVVVGDGATVGPGDIVVTIRAPLPGLLGAQRTLLNLLTHLSGIATTTRAWADAVAGTGCVVRDTRKTLPGLREIEKYAVRCGGGAKHRMGLGDAALVKDNHVVAVGGITEAIRAVRAAAPGLPLEVECDTLAQVDDALAAGAELILLDNMGPADLRAAVVAGAAWPGVRFEASGGLHLGTVAAAAATGVHFVAVGALTHSSPAPDLGLDLQAG